MKVRAKQDGVHKYYRVEGDVFDWDEEVPLPVDPYNWIEQVPEDTANKMQEAGEKGILFECIKCGYIAQRITRFCPNCGTSADAEKEAAKIEKERADAIEGIRGKALRPVSKKIKPKGRMPMGTDGGVVDKDQEV